MNFTDYFIKGLGNTLKFRDRTGFSFQGKMFSIAPNTVIDSWYLQDFKSASYKIAVEYGKDDIEHVEILLSARDDQASITVYGRTNLGRDLVQYTATVTNSVVNLIASPYYAANGTTPLLGVNLVLNATYSQRVNNLEIHSTTGETDSTGGQIGTGLNWTGSALPGVTLDSYGRVFLSNIAQVIVPGQAILSAGFILDTINFVNTDTSIGITTNTSTNTITFTTLGNIPNLTVNNSINITAVSTSSIDNTTIGSLVAKPATFTSLSSSTVIATGVNQLITISPTGTGAVVMSSGATGSINSMTIGANSAKSAAFTALSSNNATSLVSTNQNFTISTTGSSTFSASSGTRGSMNNITVGNSTPRSGAFTTLQITNPGTTPTSLITVGNLTKLLLGVIAA